MDICCAVAARAFNKGSRYWLVWKDSLNESFSVVSIDINGFYPSSEVGTVEIRDGKVGIGDSNAPTPKFPHINAVCVGHT